MCVVSMVIDQGRKTWPYPYDHPYVTPPWNPPLAPAPKVPTAEEWAAFLELVRKAAEFDRITGQPDCEDPEKVEWMEAMDERMARIEKALGIGDEDAEAVK